MAISSSEWANWLLHPVTREVVAHLHKTKTEAEQAIVTFMADTVEQYGIEHIARRNHIAGMGEFLDLESLAEVLGVPNED